MARGAAKTRTGLPSSRATRHCATRPRLTYVWSHKEALAHRPMEWPAAFVAQRGTAAAQLWQRAACCCGWARCWSPRWRHAAGLRLGHAAAATASARSAPTTCVPASTSRSSTRSRPIGPRGRPSTPCRRTTQRPGARAKCARRRAARRRSLPAGHPARAARPADHRGAVRPARSRNRAFLNSREPRRQFAPRHRPVPGPAACWRCWSSSTSCASSPSLAQSLPKIVGVCALVLLTLVLGLLLNHAPWHAVLCR